jgi:hypothetical protein
MIYDEGYMKKEEGNMIYVEGNMLKDEGYMKNDIRNKLLDIMKQVIEEGYIKKEEVLNWRLNDTREMLNDIFIDYPNWEKDLMKFGLDGFVMRMDKFTKVEPDYIVINTLRAHSIL